MLFVEATGSTGFTLVAAALRFTAARVACRRCGTAIGERPGSSFLTSLRVGGGGFEDEIEGLSLSRT